MKDFQKYFLLFLNIESSLTDYFKELEYNDKTKHYSSERMFLFLLEICPAIEALMVDLSLNSTTVKTSLLWKNQYNFKIWKKVDNKDELKINHKGNREISSIKNFGYVCETIFKLSSRKITFYYNKRLRNKSDLELLAPFNNFSKLEFNEKSGVIKLDSPIWWNAYNKTKHDFINASVNVTFKTIIDALGAYFILLIYSEPDISLLEDNNYIKIRNEQKTVNTKLFEAIL